MPSAIPPDCATLTDMTYRVLVAMSGGVDSSVTAALLRQQGHAVVGVTMKLAAGVCCDIASAMAVCDRLGIPHRVIDAQDLFSREIISPFVTDYLDGRTPNPCVRCNDLVKFRLLLDYARAAGFTHLATGHYARVEQDHHAGHPLLKKGVDPAKDQSYFLYRLSVDQLRQILFPLGEYRKTDVRRIAGELRLPAADRPESQEICFIPDNNYRSFVKEHANEGLQPGDLVMTDGTVVGRHDGIALFTVGQRRKLGVAAGERLYVVRIEPDKRRVVLGKKQDLEVSVLMLADTRFPAFDRLVEPIRVEAKIRYRSPLAQARIEPAGDNRIRVTFDHPVLGVSPGQACVFYKGDVVLGGGTIQGA